MQVLKSNWADYELLDSGNGKRLERFGKYRISRPDPQCIWKPNLDNNSWNKTDADFISVKKADKGVWKIKEKLPEKWLLNYKNIKLWVKLSPFKHTGVFPEQSAQWEWLEKKIINFNSTISVNNNGGFGGSNIDNKLNILNLFAYTGGATMVCASLGAKVTHLDASRPSLNWARENQIASNLQEKPIRWILDDAVKFLQREIKREVKYDGIIMDPPIYGHGPEGEKWDFYRDFPLLLGLCKKALTAKPLFIIVNAYAISASFFMLENLLYDLKLPGLVESGELVLEHKNSNRLLSTGIFSRWSAQS